MYSFYASDEKTKLSGIATGANKTTVTNNLTSTSTTNALSAYQGKVLNEKIMPKTIVSDEWVSSKTYSVGDYCISDNALYKCKVQNSNQQPPNDTYWDNVSVTSELSTKSWTYGGVVKKSTSYTIPSEAKEVMFIGYNGDTEATSLYKNPLGTYPIDVFPSDGKTRYFTSGGLGNQSASMVVARFSVNNKVVNLSFAYQQGSSGSNITNTYAIEVYYK